MANEEIVIDISANGDVKVEGVNIQGPDCKELTKGIERELGAVTLTTTKPEYHRVRTAARTKTV